MTTNKKIGLTLSTIVVLVAAGIAYTNYKDSKGRPTYNNRPSSLTAITTQTTPVATSTAKTYILAQVATHKDATSCWTTINGSVYDVTSWISQHPGGQQAILGLCGIDGSEAFNGQHGGQARPASELASFKIGTLIQ